ncbi:MAG: LamB/YcsF family protein [Actinomycetota bacterium]|nr:LamB/YcsF family protein [Actinomycetota bacterium]
MDLNADVGESFGRWTLGDDDALLGLITSANVAAGFHAGDPLTLRRTCAVAAARGVTIGAQVGYRDLAGFGRRFMDVAADDLAADVLYQLGALAAMAHAAGARVRFVKPHGALYHALVSHGDQAGAVVEAVATHDRSLALLGPPGSAVLARATAAGLRAVPEAFADRSYRPDGTLTPRTEPDAVLTDPEVVAARVVRMVTTATVEASDGSAIAVAAESICLHGDTPDAVAIARAVRAQLAAAGVTVRAFVEA